MDTLNLPDGLALQGFVPEWLQNIWPLTLLNSSVPSVVVVFLILVGLVVVLLIAAAVSRGLPKVLNVIAPALCLILLGGTIYTGYIAYQTWSNPNSISTASLNAATNETNRWLTQRGIYTDPRTITELVCSYYDKKNTVCIGAGNPLISVNGSTMRVRLAKGTDGRVQLYNASTNQPV